MSSTGLPVLNAAERISAVVRCLFNLLFSLLPYHMALKAISLALLGTNACVVLLVMVPAGCSAVPITFMAVSTVLAPVLEILRFEYRQLAHQKT